MKTEKIVCDSCTQEIHGKKFITIGSKDGKSLRYENNLFYYDGEKFIGEGQMMSMREHSDLHFCCKEHFVDYFFSAESNAR